MYNLYENGENWCMESLIQTRTVRRRPESVMPIVIRQLYFQFGALALSLSLPSTSQWGEMYYPLPIYNRLSGLRLLEYFDIAAQYWYKVNTSPWNREIERR